MRIATLAIIAHWLALIPLAAAAEHKIEVLKEPPPSDALAKAIAAQLSETGVKVVRGESRTVCEIWPVKEWKPAADYKPSPQAIYPFQPGQLIGVLRLKRSGTDFRDQDIKSGVYTLRYAQQPVDGNHVGTSPTIDFLLMVRAEDDKSADPIDGRKLEKLSAKAAGSSHPALLCLQRVSKDADAAPAIRHNADRDWWIARLASKLTAGGQSRSLPVEVVVAGHAPE